MLDALLPSVEAFREFDPLLAAIDAASQGVDRAQSMSATKGRARLIGEQGQGYPDARATAYLRFLETMSDTAVPANSGH